MSLFSQTFERATGIKLPDLRRNSSFFSGKVSLGTNYLKDLKIKPWKFNLDQFKGFNVPEINMPTLSDNTPDFSQLQPNMDQDLSKISLTGLAESAQKQGGEFQKELVNIGAAGQEALVNIGAAGQQALTDAGKAGQQNLIDIGGMVQQGAIDAGSATQTNAIELASLTGIKNEAVEKEIAKITKGIENEIRNITKGVEGSIATEIKGLESTIATETKGFEDTLATEVKGFESSLDISVKGFEGSLDNAVKSIEELPELDILGGLEDIFDFYTEKDDSSEESTATVKDPMPELPEIGDEEVFPEIEGSTTKADKLTEEERQRRIRRLMLNRYGREDTVLTGARDMTNRRRYASAL
jgi:hypothetical protein